MQQEEMDLRKTLELKVPDAGRINYSVKAGAGGGKTTMLSFRICEQILEGTPIEEFVIITYTNAAAAELREKITDRLWKRIGDGISDPVQRGNAQKALNNIELMQISTIHSFLLKILREYAFESGITLDARMLESVEDNNRKLKFFNEWYRDHFPDFKNFYDDWTFEQKTTKKKVNYTRDIFLNLFMELANVREKIELDTADNAQYIESIAQKYATRLLANLANYSGNVYASAGKVKVSVGDLKIAVANLIGAISTLQQKINNVSAAVPVQYVEECSKLADAMADVKSLQDKGDSIFAQRRADLKGIRGYYYTFPSIEYDWNFKKVYNLLKPSPKVSKAAKYVLQMQTEYRKRIDAQTQELSNDDILYRAERLIEDHSQIRDELRKRYTKIYVDEFQDTTGLQAHIVKMLAQDPGTMLGDDTLASNRLLVVGDPKQSIYRFTGAEISVYEKIDKLLAQASDDNSMSVTLNTNFRSNKTIVDWVNRSFKALMPNYSPMDTDWTVSDPLALHGVFRYEPSGAYSKAEDVEAVAELVEKLVNEEVFLEEPKRKPDGSFDTPALRRIRYSDIMIITQKTTNMDGYVNRFSELGIPVNVQGKFSIRNDVVLRNFLLLVEYFANYKNKKKRITAAEILGRLDVTKASADVKAVSEMLWKMRRFFRNRKYAAADVVKYLQTREDLFLPKGVEQKKENVRSYRIRLNQMVETCLMNNTGDLYELSRLMNEYIEKDVQREIPLESNENALRLMNVHQAKGLTGQVVIIADRSSNEHCHFSGYKKSGSFYPSAEYKVSPESEPTIFPGYGYDVDLIKNAFTEEREEAIRLQYVAATRAAHALIIMPPTSAKVKPWFSEAEYKYDSVLTENDAKQKADTENAAPLAAGNASGTKSLNLSDLEKNKDSLGTDELERLSERQIFSITPSGMEKPGVTGYTPADTGYVEEKRPGGNIFGTVMHRVYELLVGNYEDIVSKTGDEMERALTRIINQAVLEQNENMRRKDKPDEFVSFLLPIVRKYISTVFAPIMAVTPGGEKPEVYTEYSFSFFVDASERAAFIDKFGKYLKHADREGGIPSGCKIWVNGQADLVVKQADNTIKVYDYKSDAMRGKPLQEFEASCAAKYEGQLALYRYAVGKSFGVKPDDVKTELVNLYR